MITKKMPDDTWMLPLEPDSTCQLWQAILQFSYRPCRRSSIANGFSVLLVVVKLVTICRCILHIMHCSGHRISSAQQMRTYALKQTEITH